MKKKGVDPIAQLLREHNEALLQLKNLNKAVGGVAADGYSAERFRQIRSALRFIEEEVGVHNRREEEALFPVLERYVVGPTKLMREDHRKLRKGFRRLDAAVKRFRNNRDSFSAVRRLRVTAGDVVQLFVNHIHQENYILFPLVQRFLSREELREIARRMI